MVVREACPTYGSYRDKKNGPTRHGKQTHQCQACGRQFVADAVDRSIAHEQRLRLAPLVCERLSLRGLCRAVGVSLTGLLHFLVAGFTACPDHVHAPIPAPPTAVLLSRLAAAADARWRFVPKKANKPGIWLAMDATTRQIIAWHLGERSRDSAKELWAALPEVSRAQATFPTDQYDAYSGVMPAKRHTAMTKKARKTNHLERFNTTLRPRVSRLVRATRSFSKTLAHHIGAIKYFLGHYTLTKAAALPV